MVGWSLVRTRCGAVTFAVVASVTAMVGPARAEKAGDEDAGAGSSAAAADEPPGREATAEELAAARALFKEGKALEAEGSWAEALARFERVAEVKMTPQVRFHLALCHENLGRWVDAINGYELAAQEAANVGDAAATVAKSAPPRAAKLRARVPTLRLVIKGTVRSSAVFIDDREISLALAGTEVPIDPGTHAIQVRRDGQVTTSAEVTVEEGDAAEVELEIDDPVPPAPAPDPAPPPVLVAPPPGGGPEAGAEGVGQWPAYVVAGAGAAGLIAGGVLWGLRSNRIDAVRCDEGFTGCNPDDEDLVDEARRFDLGSKVSFGVGAGLVAAGAVLWFVLWEPDGGAEAAEIRGRGVAVGPFADGGAELRLRF